MNILFVHQNMPGQHRELLMWLVAQGGHRIVFLTQRRNAPWIDGVMTVVYKSHHKPGAGAYGLSKVWEAATGAGFAAAMAARELEKNEGFRPDLILGHTGWGELLFMKQIWPDVPIPGFFEYFHNATGGVVGFDPDDPVSDHTPFLMEARNAVPYANIQHVDLGHVPTVWQKNTFPASFHPKFYTCHDGIRTDRLGPDPDVSLSLGRLDRPVTRGDEVFTYMARNPEHVRGFHIFMAALPRILAARPGARVPGAGGGWRRCLLWSQERAPRGVARRVDRETRRQCRLEPGAFSGAGTLFELLPGGSDQPLPSASDHAVCDELVAAGINGDAGHYRGLGCAFGARGNHPWRNRIAGGFP